MGLEEENAKKRAAKHSQALIAEFQGLFTDGVPNGIQEGWLESTRKRLEDEMFEADMNDVGDPANVLDRLKQHLYQMLMDDVNPSSRRWTDDKNQQIQKMVSDYSELVVNRS